MNKFSSINDKYFSFQEKINLCIKNFDREGKLIKDSRNTVKVFRIDDLYINIKKFKRPNFINRLVYSFFRSTKACRSFLYANKLLDYNILTPDPIAYIENSKYYLLDDSFYVCKNIDYDFDMKHVFENKELEQRDKLIKKFVLFTHKLHENGIMFLDHSTSNTIIKKIEGNYKLFLIDLNRMNFKKMNFEDRLINFRRLNLSDDSIKKVSHFYSEIVNVNKDLIFEKIKKYSQNFQINRRKRKKIKNIFKN
ncbi:MAG: lipopolysaccharide kinase InaA family protein [Flavobacteriaceae bacterium]|nr:lipopolysaccharide kinase [Flavobacteriaceae bacterium]